MSLCTDLWKQNKRSKTFKQMVLPSIRTYGAYITKDKAIELFGLIDNDEADALRKVNNPRCVTKLHDIIPMF